DIGTGSWNTMIGQGSGAGTEHADYNTFVGWFAGWGNNRTSSTTNANRNTYLGAQTGYTNRDGEDNVGMGAFADYDNSNRSRTTFIGAYSDADHNDVTLIGYDTKVSGRYGIALGNEAETTGTNSIAIGYQATATASNEVYIGNSSMVHIGGAVNWTAVSDGRYKNNVNENVPGLSFISKLRPVTYNFDIDKLSERNGQNNLNPTKENIVYSGFIAQEVLAAAREINYDFSGVKVPTDSSQELYGLRYAEMVVPLVKAVQELNEKVENMEASYTNNSTHTKKGNRTYVATLKRENELLKEQNRLLQLTLEKYITVAAK
ncbi:MAG: hypothetical protein ACJAR8_001866, partial [Bacteroidia bacterium]